MSSRARLRTTGRGVVLAAAVGLLAPTAEASAAKLTFTAAPFVVFGDQAQISGHLSGGPNGGTHDKVVLYARAFPYRGEFKKLATRRTNSKGDFSLSVKQSHNTQYRLFSPDANVGTRRFKVYVDDALDITCTPSLCAVVPSFPPGPFSMRLDLLYRYPRDVNLTGRRVYLYRSPNAATRGDLVDSKKLTSAGKGKAKASFTVQFPAGTQDFHLFVCHKEPDNDPGFGIPAHGRHNCGTAKEPRVGDTG